MIDTPELTVSFFNSSDAVIDAVEILICPKNRFGEPLEAYGYSDLCFLGTDNDILAAETLGTETWTLDGYHTATGANLTVLRVHFIDRATWDNGKWVP